MINNNEKLIEIIQNLIKCLIHERGRCETINVAWDMMALLFENANKIDNQIMSELVIQLKSLLEDEGLKFVAGWLIPEIEKARG